MLDHVAWLERLRQFVAGWQVRLPEERRHECYVRADPPLTPDQVRQLRDELDCPLPAAVEDFLTRAAGRIRFECRCPSPGHPEVFAGGELFHYWFWWPDKRAYADQFVGPLEGMAPARELARDVADRLDSECVLDRAFWHHALPLTRAPNTDGLALWVYDPDHADPPVVCLSHDDVSFLLSPSFDAFLEQWEYLGYDFGEEYRDPGTGLMDVTSPAAVARRALLRLGG